MISGDYTERTRRTNSGKIVTDKIVVSTTGVEYAIGSKLGQGGVAKVFYAFRVSDKKKCVFKEYTFTPELRRVHMYIKKNIKRLIQNMLTEKDGAPLKSFIGPMDMIELPASKGFGYIMERVDLNQYLSVPQLRHKDKFPDAETICKIGINITHFFARVHISGLCYKDINEGNVYIHPKTGEIIVLDCDNISTQHTTTIKGTTCYMAPEVYGGVNPDIYTDYHSMAVLFYRILTGGYPFAGKWAQKYMLDNELSEMEAAPVVYGSRALFVFDLKDKSNTIKGLVDPQKPNLYKAQELSWELLPEELKNLFVKTFSTGLKEKDRIKRASDTEWKKAFENIQKNGIVKCRCG